jgi:CobQ-like glutamine amidotransferase family enzyme
VCIANIFPDLLGTYGDGGNAVVLARRLEWRGIPAQVVQVQAGTPVPEHADLYCLGGGEDAPQARAAELLRLSGSLAKAVDSGAVLLAVCAGFQIAGEEFSGPSGSRLAGLGIIPAVSVRAKGRRAVGEVTSRPVRGSGSLGLAGELLTGFENHAGITTLSPVVSPLGKVLKGVGNGTAGGGEGALHGRVVGTYMHGPVLARNPKLADWLLEMALGPLPPVDLNLSGDTEVAVSRLRAERLRHIRTTRSPLGNRAPCGRTLKRLWS